MKPIAYIKTDFPEKFGLPRQSGLVKELKGIIYFENQYRDPASVRGLEGFDYIWLIWNFQETERKRWSPTVRPPRLGGNKRIGVFATRSPFRPNPIGLSCVRLEKIEQTEKGPILHVAGIDLKDKTPIIDIKPYLPFTDSHPNARAGFTEETGKDKLIVVFPDELIKILPEEKRAAAIKVLGQDPRPHYQHDKDRKYGINFAGYNIVFSVEESLLKVQEIQKLF